MVDYSVVQWQNRSIIATSDFRGPLIMALPVAAFWFLWQWLSLPGLVAVQAEFPPLLRFAFDKARYMPDFGLIIAGFAAFHFQRGLKSGWDMVVARDMYLRLVLPLLAYFLLALVLFESVALLGPDHHLLFPWSDRLLSPAFWITATMVIAVVLLPPLLCLTWTSVPDICIAGIAVCFAIYGISFELGFHRYAGLWPVSAITDFILGLLICAALFRGVTFLSAVRGPAIILGWVVLLGGSILDGPGLFFLGFVMILGGMAVGERSWYLIGEKGLLAWSRTALAFALVQPAVLTAWVIWAPSHLRPFWLATLIAAAVTQLLAVILYAIVMLPARRFFAAPPAQAAAR
ncbi:hypothetical protein ACELLULO517_05445 [Acidisoma cellulosilytica]|uniref:Uncharacterized protein n=1 Tax=Acidisoma cellulosilyticum TaxID=2802395 RepID=A0A963YZC5_9PROT|nr:hypothetical protein [Acidisoma cellulosilyticum]MCB8879669.1 hypothetical protein [Acidisoma cellulosilyticum]